MPFWFVMVWSIIAVAPVCAYFATHFLQEGVSTGFIHADMPYYSANGREIFERGDGIFYPNPYETAPDAPVIYFQWLIWLMGFGIVYLGFDPGIQFVTIGLIAALVCAFLTFRLVELVLPNRRYIGPLYLSAMWGGGGFVLVGVAKNLWLGEFLFHDLTRFMPDEWFFLNWGLNSFFATEAVYHAIVAAMWLFMLKDKQWMAIGAVGLLAATHPYSGLQHLFGVSVWYGLYFLKKPAWQRFAPLFVLGVISASFLYYYMLYLPTFDSHASLQADWSLNWNVNIQTLLIAYGSAGYVVIFRLIQDRNWMRPELSIFLVSFLCSLFLAKHELWTQSNQPIHFTRGYLWMPLWLIALPTIQSELINISGQTSRLRQFVVIILLSVVIFLDNLCWLVVQWPTHEGSEEISSLEYAEPFVLTEDQWDVIQYMRRFSEGNYLLSTDEEISYLLPTYTSVNVYIGHFYNTPNLKRRRKNYEQWIETGTHDGWLDDITHIVLDRKHHSIRLSSEWQEIYRNSSFIVFERKSSSGRGQESDYQYPVLE